MTKRSRKQKARMRRESPQCDIYRIGTIDRGGIDEETRSFPIILATENPVETYDRRRMEVVDEVLRLDGLERGEQVTMVDSHQSNSVRHTLGSIRNLQAVNGQLRGRAFFAADEHSVNTFRNYADGHLNDFSIGARMLEAEYDGTDKTVTRSQLIEGSAVVAGADSEAKAMRAYADPQGEKERHMEKALRALLVERGMNTDATDAEAIEFAKTLTVAADETPDPAPVGEPVETEPGQFFIGELTADTTASSEELVAAERARVTGIDDICRQHDVADDLRRQYVANPAATPDTVAREVLKTIAPTGEPVGTPAEPLGKNTSENEKFYDMVRAGFVTRCISQSGVSPRSYLARVKNTEDTTGRQWNDPTSIQRARKLEEELQNPAPGADNHRYTRIPDLARMFLERKGERVDGLPQQEIVRRAIQMPVFVQRASDGAAFHVTGSFSNLMLDAANKTLLAAYDEAEASYPQWVRTAPSATDFKTLNRIRFGEMTDPEVVPENTEYKEKTTSDNNETYNVEKRGALFSISFEALVNDDLNALTRIPQMQGNAMRRKINKDVYAILTANDNLSDSIALFHATSHGANLDATALSEAALDTGYNVMATQTGLSADSAVLNVRPAFLIIPMALSATALRLVTGGIVPATTANLPIYGAGRPRPLTVVSDGELDGSSTTQWYLAANSSQVDTVEITFLQGEESPVLSREDGFTTDTIKYKIRQTYAPKAIDFRGLYKGNA